MHRAFNYTLIKGRIYRRNDKGLPRELVLTRERQREILMSLHEGSGHKGKHATHYKVWSRFYWPNITRDIEEHIRTCEPCQHRDYRKYEAELTSPDVPTVLGTIHIDCTKVGKKNSNGDPIVLLLARDSLTGWVEGKIVERQNAITVAEWFETEFLARWGIVGQVTADQGPEFKGEFKQMLARYKIKYVNTSSYNPAANGVVENGNKSIKEAIFKRCRGDASKWAVHLPYALWADRSTVRRSTGFSPFYMMFGQEPVLPIDWEESTMLISNWENVKDTSDLIEARMVQLERKQEDLQLARVRAQKSRQASIEHANQARELRHRGRDFKIGELVLVRNNQQDNGQTIRSLDRWRGPFRIADISDRGSMKLAELDGTLLREKVGHNRIRRFYTRAAMEVTLLEELGLPTDEVMYADAEVVDGEDLTALFK